MNEADWTQAAPPSGWGEADAYYESEHFRVGVTSERSDGLDMDVIHVRVQPKGPSGGPIGSEIGRPDLRGILDDIIGAASEAVELYPAAIRAMEDDEDRHLYCLPPGLLWPIGALSRLASGDLPDG
jgi:hypothetical protein